MPQQVSNDTHTALAKACFNLTWSYLDRSDRTPDDDEAMINAAHASRYHWNQVGGPKHFARGEWQLSRVYATLARQDPALRHARRCLAFCEAHQLSAFDHAEAHEALARAAAIAGDAGARKRHLEAAADWATRIDDAEDREIAQADLASVPECAPPAVGEMIWRDLTIPDAERVRDFYAVVVGWRTEPVRMGEYDDFNMIDAAGRVVAGVCHARGSNADLPATWLQYVRVADLDASLRDTKSRGGKVLVGAKKMFKDRYGVIEDPAGGVLALIGD